MKKTSLKTIAALAVAMTALSPSPAAAKQSNQSIQKEQINQSVKTGQQVVKQAAGGFEVIGYNEGVPPHIYGQFYVKRGTHKRTNKKK